MIIGSSAFSYKYFCVWISLVWVCLVVLFVCVWFLFSNNTILEYMLIYANYKQSVAFMTIVRQNIALKSYPENKESEGSWYT